MKTKFALAPRSVLKIYSRLNGGDVHTRAIIAMALREGTLQARYNERWTSEDPDIFDAWKQTPTVKDEANSKQTIISRSFWWKSASWSDDILDWDFRRSRMIVTLSRKPYRRVMLKGIKFNSLQIRNILSPGSPSLEAGSFDKVHSSEMWRRFWHDMIILAAGSKDKVRNSGLASFSSGEAMLACINKSLHGEDYQTVDSINHDEIAKALAERHHFLLKDSAVLEEIKALRRSLDLKTWGRESF